MKVFPFLAISCGLISPLLIPLLIELAPIAQAKQAVNTAQTKSQHATSNSAQMQEVLKQYDGGHFEDAADLCLKVLAADPKNLTAHYVLGNINVKLNHIQEAIGEYQACLQSPAAKTSPEAAYARRALQQISAQNNAPAAAPQSGGGTGGAQTGSMVGSNKGAEEYIQEQTDLLMKESKEKEAVKRRTMNDKITQIQDEIKQQLLNLPRVGGRRVAAQDSKNEAQDQIKQDGQQRIEQLKKDFQREIDDLNQSYQNRISALTDHYHNMESRRTSSGGSR